MLSNRYLVIGAFALPGMLMIDRATAQTTAFTYQGVLNSDGAPADGLHDLRCKLFNAPSGDTQIGSTLCVDNVDVVAGLFTVQLDFGQQYVTTGQRHLQIDVRADTGLGCSDSNGFVTLSPRQQLTAAPFANHARSAFALDAADGSPMNAVFVGNEGDVGVGTSTPFAKLHVDSGDLYLGLPTNGWFAHTRTPFGGDFLHLTDTVGGVPQFQRGLTLSKSGDLGLGTAAPLAKLHVDSGDLYLGLRTNGWFFHTRAAFNGDFFHLTDTVGGVPQFQRGLSLTKSGSVGIGTTAPQARLDVNGTTRTKVLEIAGADLAEKFPTSETVEPGMVVAIDRENAGNLCVARGAYNQRVAGVVSGANDFAVGAVLGNLPGSENATPVAMSGRVYVWCDAADTAIEPGDLLTTSHRAGHAMKGTDAARMHGAVIGKAMTSLSHGGRGLVLVLINLQ